MRRNEAHPITVEVVRNAIVAYADEMANALCKAAYNMMIYEVRDYCCGLIDTAGPHDFAEPRRAADLSRRPRGRGRGWHSALGLDGFAPGDVLVMNYGEVCGQHLNNVVVYCPCLL